MCLFEKSLLSLSQILCFFCLKFSFSILKLLISYGLIFCISALFCTVAGGLYPKTHTLKVCTSVLLRVVCHVDVTVVTGITLVLSLVDYCFLREPTATVGTVHYPLIATVYKY
jgi:hypothetical protein